MSDDYRAERAMLAHLKQTIAEAKHSPVPDWIKAQCADFEAWLDEQDPRGNGTGRRVLDDLTPEERSRPARLLPPSRRKPS